MHKTVQTLLYDDGCPNLTPMASFGYLKKRGVLFHTWAKLTYTGIVLADYMPCMVHMHALKVSHSVILYVHNSDFSEIAINHVLEVYSMDTVCQ